jgi:hypothetical protein
MMNEIETVAPTQTRVQSLLLWAAVLMPIVYFGAQLAAAPFYPKYSFVNDIASLLGSAASRRPFVFNDGAMTTGILGLSGAVGLFLCLKRRSGLWGALTGLCVVAIGVLSLKAGMYPMPDPRRQFLLFPTILAPFVLLLATWRFDVRLRWYLIVDNLALLTLLPSVIGVSSVPAGILQRLFALIVLVPPGAVAGWLLLRKRPAYSGSPVSVPTSG